MLMPEVQAYTGEKVVEHPGFVTSNTSGMEIRKIVLASERTCVDAVIYGKPGTPVSISSDACLRSGDATYRLRGATV